jgi:hypothetical protein
MLLWVFGLKHRDLHYRDVGLGVDEQHRDEHAVIPSSLGIEFRGESLCT